MFSEKLKSSFVLALPLVAVFVAIPLVLAGNVGPASSTEPATPGLSGVAIQLLEIKATQEGDPRESISIVDSAEPGTTIERLIRITNVSTSTEDVLLYTTAAEISAGGFVALEGQNALAGWTSVGRNAVTLAPAEAIDLTVRIVVPADAPPGEQYAAIWAEVHTAPDPATDIATSNRAGLRIYLSVGGSNAAAPDFTIDSLSATRSTDGTPMVHAAVTNTGGRAIELLGSLELTAGPGNLSAGPIDLDSPTALAPGETGRVTVTLDSELPSGPWDATITLTGSSVTHERTTQVSFDAETVEDEGFFVWLVLFWLAYWPWLIFALAILAAFVMVLAWLGARRRSRARARARAIAAGLRDRDGRRRHRAVARATPR